MLRLVFTLQKTSNSLNARISLRGKRKQCNALHKCGVLLDHALGLAFGVNPQHIFKGVPQQIGGYTRGFLDPLRHPETLGHLLLALGRSGIAQLHQLACSGDFQNERDFFLLQTKGG